MPTPDEDVTALDETRQLLAWADRMRIKRKEIAEILGVSVQRVSDYYRAVKGCTGYVTMPMNNRRVLRAALERYENEHQSRPTQYPSQRTAAVLDLVEQLGRETEARGDRWALLEAMVKELLRQPRSADSANPEPKD